MRSDEIRRRFVTYFERQGHLALPSASLIPHDDPSVLFTSAGMQQFAPYFVGAAAPPASRLVTVQRCVRTDDIEEVGDDTHHTFFEMLGNFSFGDYFKQEAIAFAYEFVTEELGLPPERLWAAIFAGEADIPRDDEAEHYWQAVGIPAARIRAYDRSENWWELATGGPCGPCSEIHLDRGPDAGCGLPLDQCGPNHCGRFVEIWNLVFNQYNKAPDGTYSLLERTGIDTGAGFERIVALLQDKPSAYETDLFAPLIAAAAAQTRVAYGEAVPLPDAHDGGRGGARLARQPDTDLSLRIIAEHLRAATFLVADGALPSSEGRGYVVRRLIRRAVRHSRLLGSEAPITGPVVAATLDRMAEHYPHLAQKRALIERATADEEAQFGRTLDAGTQLLEDEVAALKAKGDTTLPGDTAFRLYDTFGFPLPLTEEIAAAQGVQVDTEGFEQRMAAQRERSRAAQQFEQWRGVTLPAVEVTFEGYTGTEVDGAEVLWIGPVAAPDSADSARQDDEPVAVAESGTAAMIVLDRTPFYAEGGGQVADSGTITGPHGRFTVQDVQRPAGEVIVHIGEVVEGQLAVGERVGAHVDRERRAATARHHSATHLLHAALRAVLGEHVQQSGSLVAPERLRFDFSHRGPLSPDEQREIERRVNAAIRANVPVEPTVMPLQEALTSGALAFFDERYGEQARVVRIGDLSRELCGGTHVAQTGAIGSFMLTAEGSIGSGLRRVEAVTGAAAESLAADTRTTLETLNHTLGVPAAEVVGRVKQLQAELAEAHRQLAAASRQSDQSTLESVLQEAVAVNGAHVLATEVAVADMRALRETGDWLRDRLPGPAALILGTTRPKRPQLLVTVPRELVNDGLNAGALLREVAAAMGAKGGGRADMAQGGGGDPSRLAAALAHGRERATAILGGGDTPDPQKVVRAERSGGAS